DRGAPVFLCGVRDGARDRERVLPRLARRRPRAAAPAARRLLPPARGAARRGAGIRGVAHQGGAAARRLARRPRAPAARGPGVRAARPARRDPRRGAPDRRGMTAAAGDGPTIASIRVGRVAVPLTRPWAADVTTITVLPVEVRCSDGIVGHGFSWTPTIGGGAVRAFLDEELAPWFTGRPADPAALWADAWAHVHEAGGGGVTTIALAGVDLALWDAAARRADASVTELLGRQHDRLPVYGSGVNLHYSLDELVAQVRRWVEAGHRAVKVKIGKPDPHEDLDRMRAVREVLGPDRELMVDAN